MICLLREYGCVGELAATDSIGVHLVRRGGEVIQCHSLFGEADLVVILFHALQLDVWPAKGADRPGPKDAENDGNDDALPFQHHDFHHQGSEKVEEECELLALSDERVELEAKDENGPR